MDNLLIKWNKLKSLKLQIHNKKSITTKYWNVKINQKKKKNELWTFTKFWNETLRL